MMTITLLWVQELQELVTQEQNIIMQTSNALNQCCGLNSTFAGSAEAVECHRLLLMACGSLFTSFALLSATDLFGSSLQARSARRT